MHQRNLLHSYRGMYDAQCEAMEEYFARMDQLLSRELAQERELLEDDIAARRVEGWKVLSEETYDMEGEEIVFGTARFRRLMRRSNVVTIMSYFESQLSEVTTILLREANVRRVGSAPGLRLTDFGHKNAGHTCRIALTRYIGIDDDQSLWASLKDFVKLRNLIVHQGGIVPVIEQEGSFIPEDRALRGTYKKLASSGLCFLSNGEMVVEPELHGMLLGKVRDYLCGIVDRAAEHFEAPKSVKS